VKWTAEEETELRRRHPTETRVETARAMGRTPDAISHKAFELRLPHKDGRGRPRSKDAEQKTPWVDSYAEIYSQAVRLYEANIPFEVRSRWADLNTSQRREQVAIFRIYPRNLVKYMREYGNDEHEA